MAKELMVKTRDEYGKFLKGNEGPEKRYKNAEEILEAAEVYLTKIETDKKQPTMAGLALALGFKSRQSLLNYSKVEGYEQFFNVIAYLKLRLEQNMEERLIDPNCKNVVGLIFSMKNSYSYADKTEIISDNRTLQLTGFTLINPNDDERQS
jgi:hypothetical protein